MTDTGSENLVLVDVADGIMTLTLNRPERGNGWTSALGRRYFAMLEEGARSPDVRAIIVTGAGSAFCVGGDSEILGGIADGSRTVVNQDEAQQQGIADYSFPLRIGKPIIAAVNGACFGIGMQQVLSCDIRIASENAKFSTAFARRGLAAEMGITWLLPRLVGTGHAMDLLLSARLVRAPEAAQIGLVNRVVPHDALMDEARTYAAELAGKCAPSSMQIIKDQVWKDLNCTLPESYDRAIGLMTTAFEGDDFKEGLKSWQEKREPEFAPLSGDSAIAPPAD